MSSEGRTDSPPILRPQWTQAALADSLPRALIAEGWAESIAEDWCRREAVAASEGFPGIAVLPLEGDLISALFEGRRARQVVRGLEDIAKALEAQEVGLAKAAATQVAPSRRRISRLLLVSRDGSTRFYREVDRLCARYAARLAVLVVDGNEELLGEALYGPGKRARAVLLDHKQAVMRVLMTLGDLDVPTSGEAPAVPSDS